MNLVRNSYKKICEKQQLIKKIKDTIEQYHSNSNEYHYQD